MCSWIIGDASVVTKWHQVHERSREARGQIDRFPEMNYVQSRGDLRYHNLEENAAVIDSKSVCLFVCF